MSASLRQTHDVDPRKEFSFLLDTCGRELLKGVDAFPAQGPVLVREPAAARERGRAPSRDGTALLMLPLGLAYRPHRKERGQGGADDGRSIRVMTARTTYERVASLYRHADALDGMVRAFNAMVMESDPGFARSVAELATKTGSSEEAVLARIKDINDRDVLLRGPRREMRALVSEKRVGKDVEDMAGLVHDIERDGKYASRKLAAMAKKEPEVVGRLLDAISSTIGRRIEGIPPMAVEQPSGDPGKMGRRLGIAMENLRSVVAEAVEEAKSPGPAGVRSP